MKKLIALTVALLLSACASQETAPKFGSVMTPGSGAQQSALCNLTTTNLTSTTITGCSAPGVSQSVYISGVSLYGGVATGITAAATIQYGTTGNCAAGPVVMYYCQHVATGGCEATFTTPIKVPANSEVCLLDASVGSKFVSLRGWIAK